MGATEMATTELIGQVCGLYRSQKSPEYARAREVVQILKRWGYDESADAFLIALGWGCELVQGAGLSYVDMRARFARIAGEDGLLLFCAIEAISENPPPFHPKLSDQAKTEERRRWHDGFIRSFAKYPCDFAVVRLAMCVAAEKEDETRTLCRIIDRRVTRFRSTTGGCYGKTSWID